MGIYQWSETAADNDDADASINWAEGQAPSTVNGSARAMMAAIKKGLGHIVNARDRGAVGDGSTDDTTALTDAVSFAASNKHVLYIPGGQYKITSALDLTSYENVMICGDGYAATPATTYGTEIIQHTNDTPILKLSKRPVIHGLAVRYNTQQSLSASDAIAISLNNVSGGYLQNVRVYRANVSYGIPQAAFGATSYNVVFNFDMRDVESWEASLTHFDLRNFSGGGTNCRLGPLYMNGGGSQDFLTVGQTCLYAIRGQSWGGYDITAVAIDAMKITEIPLELSNCIFNFGPLRMEAVHVDKDNDGWFKVIGSYGIGRVDSFTLKNVKWDDATAMYVYRVGSTVAFFESGATRIETDCNFGSGSVRRVLTVTSADSGTGYNNRISIGPFEDQGSQLSDRIWTDNIATLLTPVQVWDGMQVNWRQKAGRSGSSHRVVVGTAIPSSGTYAAGDELIILAPALGLPTRYKCTTGGTPGTWRPTAQTVKRDTTGNRISPSASDIGLMYMDTTLDADGMPIWWNGSKWIKSDGTDA